MVKNKCRLFRRLSGALLQKPHRSRGVPLRTIQRWDNGEDHRDEV